MSSSASYQQMEVETTTPLTASGRRSSFSIAKENSLKSWRNLWGLLRNRSNQMKVINAAHIRKVPVKVEPKVFFANERTFLAWLHMSLTLASIAVGILS